MSVASNFNIEKCCGCSACVDSCPCKAISMTTNEFGFVVPNIDDSKCVECGMCTSVCPYKKKTTANHTSKVYAAVNKDKSIVLNSSSGGVFSAIAETILLDGGIVYGAHMDESFNVRHIRVDNISELHKLRKSKYVQSDTTGIYKSIKKDIQNGLYVLFVGTPCQVSALLNYIGDLSDNLLTIDVVCHGIPSQEMFMDYLKCLEGKKGKLSKYEFRAKKNNYEGMTWYSSYYLNSGKRVLFNWPEDSYNYLYMKGLIFRDNCYSCIFSTKERISDLSLCDYWGWSNYHADDFGAGESVSGIIVSTQKGLECISKAKGKLVLVESRYENLLKHNASIYSHQMTVSEDKRAEILRDWKEKGYESVDQKYRRTHRSAILKYKILRNVPFGIKRLLRRK